jgi:hypothetical protein
MTDIRTGNLPNASLVRYNYISLLDDDIKMILEEAVYKGNFRVDADEHTHMHLSVINPVVFCGFTISGMFCQG